MALNVKDQFNFKFAINGLELPIGVGTFKKFQICENIQTKLPTIEFVIDDPVNFLHDFAKLADGSKATVLFHSDYGFDVGKPYEITFRITGTQLKIYGASLHYTCNGIFDSVKYLGALVKESFKGHTSEVMGKLASQVGLTLKTPPTTNDSQIWLPTRQTFSQFCHHLCDHGYAGENSIMSLAVTDKGEMLYKDLEKLAKSKGKVVTSGPPNLIEFGIIPMSGYEVTDMAGLGNFTYNYGSKMVQEKLTGEAETFEKYAATLFSNFLNMDSGIKELVKQVKSEYLPHDMGNCHKSHHQAEYQNKRGRSLFNNKILFTTQNSTGLSLYDVIDFQPVLPTNNKVSDILSGNYIVTAKTKYLNRNKYAERIEAQSQ